MFLLLVEFYPTFNFLIKWYCIRNWSIPLSIYICIGACVILQQATSWSRAQCSQDSLIFLKKVDSISWVYHLASYLVKKSKFGYRLVTQYCWINSAHFLKIGIKANKMLYYFSTFVWQSNKEQQIVVTLFEPESLKRKRTSVAQDLQPQLL